MRRAQPVAKDKSFGSPLRIGRFLLPMAVFAWPILYLYDHVFQVNGQYTAIGNDFIVLYYKYKVYLLDCLANFDFPLWSPAEGAGFPFYTSPFAQAFYPLNLLLVVWYKIAGSYTPLDHQVFTVLGISIFALGLFMWLRLLNNNTRAVLFAALVMSVSFKMTEILRFPNALHSAAWYPWVLYAMTKIIFSRSLKRSIYYGALLTFFVICICTAGYPYYVFYCPFLFGPYLLIFLIKPLRVLLFGVPAIIWKRAVTTLITAVFLTLLICGPYLLGIKRLMSQTTDRAGKDFQYSTSHVFDVEDTVGSLVYPPASQVEGWYFFSVSALLLIVLYLLSRSRSPGLPAEPYPAPGRCWVKLFFFAWLGTITYITYGRHSYLFILLWNYVPGFSALRVWGRLNIILVPILAWLVSIAYASFESMIADAAPSADSKRSRIAAVLVKIVATYAVILATQLYLYLNKVYDPLWLEYFTNVAASDKMFIIYGAAAFLVIALILILSRRLRLISSPRLAAVLVALVAVSTLELHRVGANMWAYKAKAVPYRGQLNIQKLNEASFRFPRTEHVNSIPLGPNFSVGVLENWYFARYVRFLKDTEKETEPRRILLGIQDGTKIFFSESIEHPTIKSFLTDAARFSQHWGRCLSYTGDRLSWEIDAPLEGYLSFIDNWEQGWQVYVDGEKTDIQLLFGTFKSVKLSPGRHNVTFCYRPKWRLF